MSFIGGYQSSFNGNTLQFVGDFAIEHSIGGYGLTSGLNLYSVALNPALTQYRVGLPLEIKFRQANTASATLNVNGCGAKAIKKIVDNALVDIVAGDLNEIKIYTLIYDGVVFQIAHSQTIANPVQAIGNATEEVTGIAKIASVEDMAAGSNNNKIVTPAKLATYIASKITGLWKNKGLLDCSSNASYPAGFAGDAYTVSAAGKIGGPYGKNVGIKDVIYCITDTSPGTEETVGTNWNVVQANLETATEMLAGYARIALQSEVTEGTDNSAFVTSLKLKTALDNRLATESVKGFASLANQSEVIEGVDDHKIVTPLKIKSLLDNRRASEAITGLTKVATQVDVNGGGDDINFVTSLKLWHLLDAVLVSASEGRQGIALLATSAEVSLGENDTHIVTPAKLAAYVSGKITGQSGDKGLLNCSTNPNFPAAHPGETYTVSVAGKIGGSLGRSVGVKDILYCDVESPAGIEETVGRNWTILHSNLEQATEIVVGFARLALQEEVNLGTNNTLIVTPLKLKTLLDNRPASEILSGLAKIATQADLTAGTDDTRVITSLKLKTLLNSLIATSAREDKEGIVQIATVAETEAGINDTKTITPAKLAGYVSGKITGLWKDKGVINCASKPNYPVALKGDAFTVSGAGQIGGEAGQRVSIKDILYCNVNTVAGDDNTVGANWTIIQSNIEQATEVLAGYAKIALQTDVNLGTDNTSIVTPLKLKSFLDTRYATELFSGLSQIATQLEVNNGANDVKYITPLKLNALLGSRNANELLAGIAEIATQAEVNSGLDDGRIVTPYKLKTLLSTFISATATESQSGSAQIATTLDLSEGTNDLKFVTPAKLAVYISSKISGLWKDKGLLDCSGNPNYPAAKTGEAYTVNVAGKIGGSFGQYVSVKDVIYCNADSGAGNEAGVGSRWNIIQSNLEQATELLAGYARIARQTDVTTGTDDVSIVTPLKLKTALENRLATELITGLAEIATQVEVNEGTDDRRIVTPLKLKAFINSTTATEIISGIAEIATQAEVNSGADDSRFVTPLKLKNFVSSQAISAASEAQPGTAQIATVQDLADGVNDLKFITPAKLSVYIAGKITGLWKDKGLLDCGGNPNYPAGKTGDAYTVVAGGKIGGSAGQIVSVKDVIYCNSDSASGTEASVGSRWTIIQSNLEQATEVLAGYARIARQVELTAGTDDQTIVTPLKLKTALDSRLATELMAGLAEIATQSEVNNGTDDVRFVTPFKLKALLGSTTATELLSGIAEIATQAEVNAGIDDQRIVTPLKLKNFIAAQAIPIASEAQSGTAQIATLQELADGINDAKFITPAKLAIYISGKITGLWRDKGLIDCGGNPNYPSAKTGDAYTVSVAGKIGGNAGQNVGVKDVIYCNADVNAGNEASAGARWTIIQSNLEQATEQLAGYARIARLEEIATGTDDQSIVTPLKLKTALASHLATEASAGFTEIATQAEVNAGLDDLRFVTPLKLKTFSSGSQQTVAAASEGQAGIAKIATTQDLNNGFDDTKIITPAKLAAYVTGKITGLWKDQGLIDCSGSPMYPAGRKGDAYTVSAAGKIGTTAGVQVNYKDILYCTSDNDGGMDFEVGYAWSIIQSNLDQATTNIAGFARIATYQEVADGSSYSTIVTPTTLYNYLSNRYASENSAGFILIANTTDIDAGTNDFKALTVLKATTLMNRRIKYKSGTAQNSIVPALGSENYTNGVNSTIVNGNSNTATGAFTTATGILCEALNFNEQAKAGGGFKNTRGSAQSSILNLLNVIPSGAGFYPVTPDGNGISTVNRWIIPDNCVQQFSIHITILQNSIAAGGKCWTGIMDGAVKNTNRNLSYIGEEPWFRDIHGEDGFEPQVNLAFNGTEITVSIQREPNELFANGTVHITQTKFSLN